MLKIFLKYWKKKFKTKNKKLEWKASQYNESGGRKTTKFEDKVDKLDHSNHHKNK